MSLTWSRGAAPRRPTGRPRSGSLCGALWAVAVLAGCDPRSVAARDRPGDELARRLQASGRAEARFDRVAVDALSGRKVRSRGRIALELPDRALLQFESTGERIALRGDGGEWLQPALRQMIVLTPDRAAAARVWWAVLAGGEPPGISIRREKDRRYLLRAAGSAESGAASATLTLDGRRLPSALELDEEGERSTYEFSSWRFAAPRGRKAFVLEAPPGFEVVPMP